MLRLYDRRLSNNGWVRRTIIHAVLLVCAIAFAAPLLLVLSSSLSTESSIAKQGYGFLPRHFSTQAYQYILGNPGQIVRAYGVSVLVTVVGTVLSMIAMTMLAYALSRPEFRARKPLSFYVMFTMLFSGGLVPTYILMTQYLYLQDTVWALILPYLVTPWYVLLLRTYFTQLPGDLLDAARIDGAGEWATFTRIALPLAKPAIATVGLFVLLMYWNDWWLGLLYITNDNLVPVQLYLYRALANIDFLTSHTIAPTNTGAIPIQTVRMAAAILAIGPIVAAFFAVQRYLVRGITVGGLKD
jgi:putative aldouronate transport system permease protein